jgi:DNA-binding PadR family transcriptional regulator
MDPTVPKDWQALNATQRDILLTLAHEAPLSGNEINERLDRRHGQRSTINRYLKTLAEDGFVDRGEASNQTQRTGRDNQLTDEGRALVRALVAGLGEDNE